MSASSSSQITVSPIDGLTVYGVQQNTYSVGGSENHDYGWALATATIRQSNAIETECGAFSAMVRLRMQKLEDCGNALAILAETEASLRTKKAKSKDKAYNPDLTKAKQLLDKYEIPLNVQYDGDGKAYITREDIRYQRAELEHQIDMEDNDLQQDTVSLQSLMSKRDNAFSTATKILNKVSKTAKTVIGNTGS